jgi:hypothetical protein
MKQMTVSSVFDRILSQLSESRKLVQSWADRKENEGRYLLTPEEGDLLEESQKKGFAFLSDDDGKVFNDITDEQFLNAIPYMTTMLILFGTAIGRIDAGGVKLKEELEEIEEQEIIDRNAGRKKITEEAMTDLKIALETSSDVNEFISRISNGKDSGK